MSTDATTRSLLIVDDEPDLLEVIQHHLEKLGVEILVAKNGVEAFEILTTRSLSAVLCDIKMPDKDGIELLTEVRAKAIDVPFVFLTGFGSKEHMLEALRLGATDFLEKPFEKEQLLEVVARAIEIGMKKQEIAGSMTTLSRDSVQAFAEIESVDKKKKQILLLRVVNNSKQKKKK